MFKRAHYVAMTSVLLLVVVLLSLPDQTAARVKLAISALFLPLFGLSSSTDVAVDKLGDIVVPRSSLTSELDRLRKENQELKAQGLLYEEVMRENSRLRQTIQWKQQVPWKMKFAKVIGRDPSNWWRMVMIDQGTEDGIRENMAVMTHEGLVGRVSRVGAHRAQVVLIGSRDCKVAALVEKTREGGVIGPAETPDILDPNIVELSYLTRNTKLEPEQLVYTSNLGGIFPKGILIGRIVDTQTVEHGLYVEARVKLAVNMNQLEEVWVILSQ